MSERNKKILILSGVMLLIIVLALIVFCNVGIEKIDNTTAKNEIVPEEEISDEQLRETMVELYYINEKNEIVSEVKKIDSKVLLNEPYEQTIKLLLEGPKSDNLKTAIPKNTKLNKVEKQGDCIIIDFSPEFIDNQTDDLTTHGLVINQIVYTMTQFSEINNVKISINGEFNKSFRNGNISFEQVFTKEF